MVLILLGQHCTGKTLCNVVKEAPGKGAQKKILFNVVLILLGQHCTGKNPVYCSRDYRQHCTGKLSVLPSERHHFSAISILDQLNFDKIRLLQMLHQHCANFPNIAQEKIRTDIEQKKTRLYGT